MPIRDKYSKFYHAPDYSLIAVFAALLIFGLVMLTSAGAAVGFQKFNDSFYFLKQQFIKGLVPGLFAFFIMSRIDYRKWKDYAVPMLLISIVLLISVFIPGLGAEYGTAKSWINIGGFSLQPSEIVKLTFLLYLASWLERRGTKGAQDIYYGLLPFIIILGVIMFLMMLQPDMGTMSIIVLISLVVYFIGGANIAHLSWITLAGFALLAALVKAAPYRTARLMTFLHPELDPQGIGYHINQALLAVGSGGLWGLGLGHSRQKFNYLPEVTGDSIFAVIGEELGMFFCILVVAAFLFLMIRGFKIARNAPDDFGKLVAVGISSWFVIQAFFNIGAMIGILPMTGIPLPFISYGGTALAVGMGAIGILVNISMQTKK